MCGVWSRCRFDRRCVVVYSMSITQTKGHKMRVKEIQHKIEGKTIVRHYNLVNPPEGPQQETVRSFFQWLVDNKTIAAFEISK